MCGLVVMVNTVDKSVRAWSGYNLDKAAKGRGVLWELLQYVSSYFYIHRYEYTCGNHECFSVSTFT